MPPITVPNTPKFFPKSNAASPAEPIIPLYFEKDWVLSITTEPSDKNPLATVPIALLILAVASCTASCLSFSARAYISCFLVSSSVDSVCSVVALVALSEALVDLSEAAVRSFMDFI